MRGAAPPHDKADDTWLTFNTGNSKLPANSTKSLALDTSGRIWVSTHWIDTNSRTDAGAGAAALDPAGTPFDRADDTWAVFRASDGLSSDAVRAVAFVGGVPFFGTKAGLSQLGSGADLVDHSDDTWRTYSVKDRLIGFGVSALAEAGSDALWIGTDSGLSLLNYHGTPEQRGDDQWVSLTTANQLPGNTIRALAVDQSGRLWIGTSAGLQVRDLKGTPADPQDDVLVNYSTPTLASNQINDIAIDAAGRAWIACGSYFTGALHVLSVGASISSTSDDHLATFATANGLPNPYVRAVTLAGQTTAWVATDGGAGQLSYGASPFDPADDTWSLFTAANSQIGVDLVRDVAIDSAGNAWFALALEGVSVYSTGGGWAHFTQSDGLISNTTRKIAQDARGRMLIGTSGGLSMLSIGAGLSDKSDDQWENHDASLMAYNSVNCFLIDGKGQTWAGTLGSASLNGQFIRRYLPLVRR
jgi:ligand-binding sensor domain-containing protein